MKTRPGNKLVNTSWVWLVPVNMQMSSVQIRRDSSSACAWWNVPVNKDEKEHNNLAVERQRPLPYFWFIFVFYTDNSRRHRCYLTPAAKLRHLISVFPFWTSGFSQKGFITPSMTLLTDEKNAFLLIYWTPEPRAKHNFFFIYHIGYVTQS